MRALADQGQPSTERALIGGRYLPERLLGQGGMGSVYAVVDTVSGVRLALKRLRADASERAAALFEREYRILAGLRHPCIVEVHDYALDDAGPYYTMEVVDGVELSTLAPVPWRTACAYLRDAASTLGLLHARRLLHRDLSPRNVIVVDSGRLKLIDFGTLVAFGPTTEVAGTPPFVAPESFDAAEIDQRCDLFALGALGYWLVSGSHAFAARSIDELPRLWECEPKPVSELVEGLGNDRLETPPEELDDLLATLLRLDPKERIASTAALIDRLNALAELTPEVADDAAQSYLRSKAFVGREPEKAHVRSALRAAQQGRGQLLLIEGEAGVGRSRFLEELTLYARLAGAVTLRGDARAGRRAYGLAEALLAGLYQALPHETRALVDKHAAALAPISPLRESLLRHTLPPQVQAVGEQRARLESALFEVFATLSREHFIALFIDDLDDTDEESRGLLSALAHRARSLRLCVVASLRALSRQEQSVSLVGLRTLATEVRLAPLSADETRELLRSVFGEVAYLDRLSERLHRSAGGSPAHTLELAQHLVSTGSARYLEGSWLLPMEQSEESLPCTLSAGLMSRLDRLSEPARALARALSVPHGGSWSIEQAATAAALSHDLASELISLLAREGVLRARDDGYVLSRDDLQSALYDELEERVRHEIHARVGLALEAAAAPNDVPRTLSACVHWMRAGQRTRAYPLLCRALATCAAGDPAHIALHAASFEQLYVLLAEAGEDDYAVCGPLGMLAVAGYFADRRYALRYGERAVESLERVLKLAWARRLAPLVGKRLALLLAFAGAAWGTFWQRRRCLSLPENVRILLLAASTLAGTAAICMDPDRAARYARSLEPLTALGHDHAATFIHDFSALMSLQGRDRPARSVSAMRKMIERLADPRPIAEMTDSIRSSYYAGIHLPMGVFLVRRDDCEGLEVADQLEQFSPLYAMSADHLRANYYAGQGDLEAAKTWRQRVEIHAVQLGSAWQAETWAPVDMINIALRLHDASALKRAALELARLLDPALTRLAVLLRQRAEGQHLSSGCLELAVELGDAEDGFLVLAHSPREAAAYLGQSAPSEELVTWASELLQKPDTDGQTVLLTNLGNQLARGHKVVAGRHYRGLRLYTCQQGVERAVATLVLAADARVPGMPEPIVVQAIAMHLGAHGSVR
ncbi:MAG: serine/threonine protein kinase [Pseudomonadota bacterium]|jgi:serine/threonine-protein kinase